MANSYQTALRKALDEQLRNKLSGGQPTSRATAGAVKSAAAQAAAAAGAVPTAGAAGTGGVVNPALQQQLQAAEERRRVLSSGNQQAANQLLQQQAADYNAAARARAQAAAQAQAAAPEMKKYLAIGKPSAGFKSGMDDADRAAWNSIGAKYAAGDQSWVQDTNDFRKEGNWSSYYDDNGKINGWLYDGSGYGGYSPVFGGRVGETGYREGNVFYAPDGSAYTMAADGTLTRSGDVTWAKYGEYIGPTAGYHPNGGSFWSTDENGNRRSYDYDTAPDDVLEREGFYRRGNAILPIDDQYRMDQAIRSGEMTLEQAAIARAMENMTPEQRESLGRRKTTQGTPADTSEPGTAAWVGGTYSSGNAGRGTGSTGNPYQAYLASYDAGYDASQAPQWEGSEYQAKRDAALQRAEDMQWRYDPETDPVYQAYQKQYRREGQRATQDTLGKYAAMTGGVPSSYAVTAASQAGDYYASQLSDKIPELYQSAYNRYLQEFQRQLGISDQYAGFDDREYNRYRDRLSQWNTDRSFNYGAYRDAVSDQRYDQEWAQKLREYADSQNWKATEWQQYLREYGDQLSEKERQWVYQMARDAVSDSRYADETAYNRAKYADETAYQRALYGDETAYNRSRDALSDERYDTQWQQSLREYDDEQAQQAWNNAYKMLTTFGSIVTQDMADILGMPVGTTLEQYRAAETGGGSGKSSRRIGGNKGTDSGSRAEAAPTGNYETALAMIRDYRRTHSDTQTLRKIETWVVGGYLREEEADQLLKTLGFVTGTGGGGSHWPQNAVNVSMTK